MTRKQKVRARILQNRAIRLVALTFRRSAQQVRAGQIRRRGRWICASTVGKEALAA